MVTSTSRAGPNPDPGPAWPAAVIVSVAGGVGADVGADVPADGAGTVLADGAAVAPAVGAGVAACTTLVMLAEQMIRAPPPLAEPLHWLTMTARADAAVPVAVQVDVATTPPPLAEPLHWVIVAPVVVAGNGSHAIVIPPPPAEPTHWLTVTPVAAGVTPTKVFVTSTLHRRVPPPPLMESFHWVTAVTGLVREEHSNVHDALGSPAAP